MVIAVLIAMLTMVFPAFSGVYDNLTGSLSASSYSYLSVSFTFCKVLLVVMIVMVAALLTGWGMWKRGKSENVKKILSKISTFKDMFDNLALYRFTSCFDMFISGGEMQTDFSLPVWLMIPFSSLKPWSEVKSFEEKLYDPISNRMLIPAERSGMLDSILVKILDGLKEKNEKYISRIANTIEPLLTGFLMITIGLMLISLMVPLIGMMNSIG